MSEPEVPDRTLAAACLLAALVAVGVTPAQAWIPDRAVLLVAILVLSVLAFAYGFLRT